MSGGRECRRCNFAAHDTLNLGRLAGFRDRSEISRRSDFPIFGCPARRAATAETNEPSTNRTSRTSEAASERGMEGEIWRTTLIGSSFSLRGAPSALKSGGRRSPLFDFLAPSSPGPRAQGRLLWLDNNRLEALQRRSGDKRPLRAVHSEATRLAVPHLARGLWKLQSSARYLRKKLHPVPVWLVAAARAAAAPLPGRRVYVRGRYL